MKSSSELSSISSICFLMYIFRSSLLIYYPAF
nr:MAG TPA: hypothetical protein [Caudoviricetes sp.]